jgi:hypothetical protein
LYLGGEYRIYWLNEKVVYIYRAVKAVVAPAHENPYAVWIEEHGSLLGGVCCGSDAIASHCSNGGGACQNPRK